MSEIVEKILKLKEEKGAVILAHNYVNAEIQDIADFTGDSLELSIKARNSKAGVIVFCGVSFMAETAKLLSPDSTVLHPVKEAGCAMADMAKAEDIAAAANITIMNFLIFSFTSFNIRSKRISFLTIGSI